MKNFIYILLVVASNTFASVNTVPELKNYADSLFLAENLFEAITEYKRLLFFDDSEIYDFEANYKIGLCYKLGGKYDDAIKHMKIAEKKCPDYKVRANVKMQIIRTNILRRTIPEALLLLEQVESQYSNKISLDSINYWRGWAYMINDNWVKASEQFEKIDSLHPLKILADSVSSKQYSEMFTKLLSFVLPGSGQFYTGNYLSGFMSLGWNVLWGYLTVHAFVTDRAIEGILIGGLLWARFYRGNFQNAEDFAIEKNRKISNYAYEYLAKKYIGEKP